MKPSFIHPHCVTFFLMFNTKGDIFLNNILIALFQAVVGDFKPKKGLKSTEYESIIKG